MNNKDITMETKHTNIYCVIFGLFLSGVLGQMCSSVNDCQCGYVCVAPSGGQCIDSYGCRCELGCFVFNALLEKSDAVVEVHGNQCFCRDPVQSHSIPGCTKMGWQNAPEGVAVHVTSDQCTGS